jgi:UDP-GlcNAc:undecaprenyl-phosphate/decaprenyl-phosphate GlcNAc-1-phosphate transferase
MCLGFLPHNFYPARIFMGDIGAMLLGLMLAYGPISSTASLDPALLTNYANHTLDRFPTLLPLLVPAAIFVIPYADLMFAIIRRTRAGKPLMAADRQHLHHRVLNIGHSYRQSVLIMYLWAALFSVTVVSLSVVRTRLIVFIVATAVAVLTLLPVTMPRLRPWRLLRQRQAVVAAARRGAVAAAHRGTVPADRGTVPPARRGTVTTARRGTAPPLWRETGSAAARPPGPVLSGASPSGASPFPRASLPDTGPAREAAGYPDAPAFPDAPFPGAGSQVGSYPLRAGQFPAAGPFRDASQFPGAGPFRDASQFPGAGPFRDAGQFPGAGRAPAGGPRESPDPLSPPPRRDARPW